MDYEVLIPDLPGYGKTPELKKHDLESYADWLINLVDQIGPDVVVLGHSFGSLGAGTGFDAIIERAMPR